MPTLHEIRQEILDRKGKAQDDVRREYLSRLADYTGRDVILYASAFDSNKNPAVPSLLLSVTLEDMQGFMSALHGLDGDGLDLILHSPGGSMEAAEQLVRYLRNKYDDIRAIVPQNAMSAATMVACACDTIVMGRHSALGPIDPQVTFPTQNGTFSAPAQAILAEFEQAKEEVVSNPETAVLWVEKLKAYPHGFLNVCQRTSAVAKEKVEEWLNSYMFREDDDPEGAAIAKWLGDASLHKTHGRPIDVDTAREHGLEVELLEDDQQLQELTLSCFHATTVTFAVTSCVKMIENQTGKGTYLKVKVQVQSS